jgi:beta-glucosidase
LVQVTNVGGRAGAEVVQLDVAAPAAARQPPRQLEGFAKAT